MFLRLGNKNFRCNAEPKASTSTPASVNLMPANRISDEYEEVSTPNSP